MAAKLELLTLLFDGPLTTPELVRKLGDPRPAQRAQAGAGYQLRRMEEHGLVRQCGVLPGAWQRPPTRIWEVTAQGRSWAEAKTALNYIEKRGGPR